MDAGSGRNPLTTPECHDERKSRNVPTAEHLNVGRFERVERIRKVQLMRIGVT